MSPSFICLKQRRGKKQPSLRISLDASLFNFIIISFLLSFYLSFFLCEALSLISAFKVLLSPCQIHNLFLMSCITPLPCVCLLTLTGQGPDFLDNEHHVSYLLAYPELVSNKTKLKQVASSYPYILTISDRACFKS